MCRRLGGMVRVCGRGERRRVGVSSQARPLRPKGKKKTRSESDARVGAHTLHLGPCSTHAHTLSLANYMSEDPAARRARLAALRAAAEGGGEDAAGAPPPADGPPPPPTTAPILKFRNYAPDAAALGGEAAGVAVLEAAKAPDLVAAAPARTVVPEGAPDEVREERREREFSRPGPPPLARTSLTPPHALRPSTGRSRRLGT